MTVVYPLTSTGWLFSRHTASVCLPYPAWLAQKTGYTNYRKGDNSTLPAPVGCTSSAPPDCYTNKLSRCGYLWKLFSLQNRTVWKTMSRSSYVAYCRYAKTILYSDGQTILTLPDCLPVQERGCDLPSGTDLLSGHCASVRHTKKWYRTSGSPWLNRKADSRLLSFDKYAGLLPHRSKSFPSYLEHCLMSAS